LLQSIDDAQKRKFAVDMGNKLRLILVIQQSQLVLVDHLRQVGLDFLVDRLGLVGLGLLVVLVLRLVLVVLLVLGLHLVLSVLGLKLSEFRLGLVDLAVLELLAVHLVRNLLLGQLVLVDLDLLLDLVHLVVHQVLVVLVVHLVLVVRLVRLDSFGMKYLVGDMGQLPRLERHRFRVVLVRLVDRVDLLGLAVLVVLVDNLVQMEYIDSELAKLHQLDAFDGRCC